MEPEKTPAPVVIELKMPAVQQAPQQQEATQGEEDKYWDGPAPTHEQRRQALNRLVEFFKLIPESPLKESYPQQANMAAALKRYDDLNFLLQKGQITQEAYDEEVEKILPLIDISEDLL